MPDPHLLESVFLIFAGAALLATLALFGRQPLLVAYIAIGCLLGPHGLALVTDAVHLSEIAEIGIIFLLFLVGLDLQPSKLHNMVMKSLLTALLSSIAFFAIGFSVMLAFGFEFREAVVTGVAVTFSSTILGIKLLPTTVLHHRHVGEIVVSLLLIQDFIAIVALLFASGYGASLDSLLSNLGTIAIALPLLSASAWLAVRFLILPLLKRFDVFHEFTFLLAIGWCLGFASLAEAAGLSLAIGAFIAGVALATSPIALYIAESLRPLRDFFLVLFFFTVGAALDVRLLIEVALPTGLLAALLMLIKPGVFSALLRWQGESPATGWEVGYRLGQASEFSLLVSYVAITAGLLGKEAAHVVQGATVLTLVVSSYLVIFRYPSPIAVRAELRRD
ncbi:MAG: cation:proton antiporter [Gammaproteobacteria bacterium]|nr:cation:proton antiporter [Gammaproteobacteria bacterium]